MWRISDRDKRIWQCFVCGVEFEEYEEFKSHILKEHEEGREYIKCPLHRCDAPVRDLSAHFKSKHPNDKIPKNCQLKASVWRDFRGNRKGTRKPVEFKSGYFTSIKSGEKFKYRSGYELNVYEALEELNECVKFHGESFKVPYFFLGKSHNYIPDLSIQFNDGSIEIWEIKPSNQTSYDKNKAKWEACNIYCEQRGWKFKVKTEKGIKELQDKVRRQSLP